MARRRSRPRARWAARHRQPRHPGSRGPEDARSKVPWGPFLPRVVPTPVDRTSRSVHLSVRGLSLRPHACRGRPCPSDLMAWGHARQRVGATPHLPVAYKEPAALYLTAPALPAAPEPHAGAFGASCGELQFQADHEPKRTFLHLP
jgi:hypothetical protein